MAWRRCRARKEAARAGVAVVAYGARVTKTTKMMIPAMLPLYRMNHALFLTATAIVTRRRALPLWHHRLHHLQWVDTAEKTQRSLLRGDTATRTT